MFTIGGEFSHLSGLYAQNFCTVSKTMIKEQCIFHWKGSISQIHGCWKKFQAQVSAMNEQLKKNTYIQTPFQLTFKSELPGVFHQLSCLLLRRN